MPRRQKMLLAAVLGSFLLHCLVVAVLFSGVLLPSMRATSDEKKIAEPDEVVILLSELLPESLDESEREKMFVRTDPDAESDEAPTDPRFESDRNTLAATEIAPVPNPESVDDLPTIDGRVDLPGLELRDRKFSDGKGDSIELPAPGSPAVSSPEGRPVEIAQTSRQAVADSVASGDSNSDPSESESLSQPKEKDGAGEASGAVESPEMAKNLQRPSQEVNEVTVEEVAADAARNPLDGNVPIVMPEEGEQENLQEKIDKPEPKALVGSPSGPKNTDGKTESDSPPKPPTKSNEPATDSGSQASPAGAMAASSSQAPAEAPAFNPETIANHVSGTLSNFGDKASVDAEGTELGSYKQGVVTAVEKSWHRFRLSNRDDVTAGNLRLRFRVDSKGQVRNLKIVRDEANIGMTEFTLKAILAADIPVMPRDVADLLGSNGLVMNYTVMVVY